MTNVEIALNAFKAGKWAEAIAAARKTDLSNAEILAWMGYGKERKDSCVDEGLFQYSHGKWQ